MNLYQPTLIVMAKAPRVGVGKTRLAAELGRAEAWRINRALQAHTLRVACDHRWRTLLCVTPDSAVRERFNVWPSGLPRVAQGTGDLGARLARALTGRRCVAIIGTDCPGLTRARIAEAFAELKRRPFALGPAHDGGFWLLAARSGRAAARAMDGVRWSSAHAAADVLRNLVRTQPKRNRERAPCSPEGGAGARSATEGAAQLLVSPALTPPSRASRATPPPNGGGGDAHARIEPVLVPENVALLPMLRDIDVAADWAAYRSAKRASSGV